MIDNTLAKTRLDEAIESLCKIDGADLARMPSYCAKLIVNLIAARDRVKASKPHVSPNSTVPRGTVAPKNDGVVVDVTKKRKFDLED